VAVAEGLPSLFAEVVKSSAALVRERLDASALLWAALAGELFTALLLVVSGTVPPVLVRSLQIFLRF
jgi:hypothetical protein